MNPNISPAKDGRGKVKTVIVSPYTLVKVTQEDREFSRELDRGKIELVCILVLATPRCLEAGCQSRFQRLRQTRQKNYSSEKRRSELCLNRVDGAIINIPK